MSIVNVRVQFSDRFSELIIDDVEPTELTIESIVSTALLEVFDAVLVENVTVHPSPKSSALEVFDTPIVENIVFPPAPEDDDDGNGWHY